MQNKTNKTIFTFWEPKSAMPEYIKLCMKSWYKFLPEYKIIVLDYSNLEQYIGKNRFNKILYKKFSLPMQADAIRCAVLRSSAGENIWMDADTIITSDKLTELRNIKTDFMLVGHHIGFIKANNNSYILKMWEKELHHRLFIFRYLRKLAKIFNKKYYAKLKSWDYLGNGILDKYLKTNDKSVFYEINKDNVSIFPEYLYYKNHNMSPQECYDNFYFKNNFENFINEHNDGMIMLHNSWTPEYYKKLPQNEILNKPCTLSSVLKQIINN